MTQQATEQIIKEAVEETNPDKTWTFNSLHNNELLIFLFDDFDVHDKTLHWREYFLSHEFCKEWFGDGLHHFGNGVDTYPINICQQCSAYHTDPNLYCFQHHLQKLVLCNNLIHVAIYLKMNPKIK